MDEDYDISGQFSSLGAALNRLQSRLANLELRLSTLELQAKSYPTQMRAGSLGDLHGTIDNVSEK